MKQLLALGILILAHGTVLASETLDPPAPDPDPKSLFGREFMGIAITIKAVQPVYKSGKPIELEVTVRNRGDIYAVYTFNKVDSVLFAENGRPMPAMRPGFRVALIGGHKVNVDMPEGSEFLLPVCQLEPHKTAVHKLTVDGAESKGKYHLCILLHGNRRLNADDKPDIFELTSYFVSNLIEISVVDEATPEQQKTTVPDARPSPP